MRRIEHFGGQPRAWKHGLTWLAVVDVDRQIILAQSAREAPWNDCPRLPERVRAAHAHTPVGCVLADAKFDSERNHVFCREELKAATAIPAKCLSSKPASGVRKQIRENFPSAIYGRRSLIETVFSAVKRKPSPRAPAPSIPMQLRQALLLGLAYILARLRARLPKKDANCAICRSGEPSPTL